MTAARPITFGAFVPQGWKTELVGLDGAAAQWDKTVEIAELADALGYDSIWVYDHFHNVPRPVHEIQQPHPPILIGGSGEQLTLRVVARLADRSNFGGKPDEFAHKCDVLRQHCDAVGRDYDEIEKTWSPEVFVRETEAELRTVDGSTFGEPFDSWRAGNLVGTPAEVIDKIGRYVEMGCTSYIPWCRDYPGSETLSLFAEQVVPAFR